MILSGDVVDSIQFAGAVALSKCTSCPNLELYAGRPEAIAPTPADLFVKPSDQVEIRVRCS